MVLYYLTRSYLPMKTGGVAVREKYVSILKENGFRVVVITVNYSDHSLREEYIDGVQIVYIPKRMNLRMGMVFERIGLLEDYLDPWCEAAIQYLQQRINREDIIFATSGGELACIKIGSVIKNICKCKFVINLHDPVDYTVVNGMIIDKKFHVSREKSERKYLSNTDLIITSSKVQLESLLKKDLVDERKIINGYFGYIKKYPANLRKEIFSDGIKVVYGGTFGPLQRPEWLAETIKGVNNIEVYFVGNYENYGPLKKYTMYKNFHFMPYMKYEEYGRFVSEDIDYGFVSLNSEYLGACVPSKIYEYINFGVPIIGILPNGDAKDLVNNNRYGYICALSKKSDLKDFFRVGSTGTFGGECRRNIMKDRDLWSMEKLTMPIIERLREL